MVPVVSPISQRTVFSVLGALVLLFGIVLSRTTDQGAETLETSQAAFNGTAPVVAGATNHVDAPQLVALPAPTGGVATQLARPMALTPLETAAPGAALAPADGAPQTDPASQAAAGADAEAQAKAEAKAKAKAERRAADIADPTTAKGRSVHSFNEHVVAALGTQMLAPTQSAAGSYERVGPYEIRAESTITALQPVIELGIAQVLKKSPNATGLDLERRVAKRLTGLNDWKNLDKPTKEKMMILSGVDIQNLNKRVREDVVNHLLHSPLQFGDLGEVLSPDTVIDLGYTHTLDKDWTQVAHLGDGVFQIWMVSNNNNGSHTGHIMGSFKVQLTAETTLQEAREVGNQMVENKNKNNKLYLDEAARKILYGETPLLDFSNMSKEEQLATYAGKGLGTYAGTTGPSPATAPAPAPDPVEPEPTPLVEPEVSPAPEETPAPEPEPVVAVEPDPTPAPEPDPPAAVVPAPAADPPDPAPTADPPNG